MKKLFAWAPPLFWAAMIYYLSDQPQLPATPGGDKLAHLGTYLVLGALAVRALYLGTGASIAVGALAGGFFATWYGILDEVHQSFVPGRSSSVEDVLADAAGALLGTLLAYAIYRRRAR